MTTKAHEQAHRPARPEIQREVLPSASQHVSLAMVQIPGPAHEIEPERYLRICFNVGPTYSFDASGPNQHATFTMRHHALMVIPPDTAMAHNTATQKLPGRDLKPARLASLRVSSGLLAECAIVLGLPRNHAPLTHRVLPSDEVIRMLAQALYTDLWERSPVGAQATERLAMALVTRLLLLERSHHKENPVQSTIDQVMEHINTNLNTTLPLEELARIAAMSVFHFCRVFQKATGATPHQYIVGRRMELARRLLWSSRRENHPTMLDVAFACGFNSQSHFAAQFRRHSGQTPRQWQLSFDENSFEV